MYTGDIMKKTEFITLRTDQQTKAILEKVAAEKKWSISQLSEEIIQQWIRDNGLQAEHTEKWKARFSVPFIFIEASLA